MTLPQFFTLGSSRLGSTFADMYSVLPRNRKGLSWIRMMYLLESMAHEDT